MAINRMMDEAIARISVVHGLRLPKQDLNAMSYVLQRASWHGLKVARNDCERMMNGSISDTSKGL